MVVSKYKHLRWIGQRKNMVRMRLREFSTEREKLHYHRYICIKIRFSEFWLEFGLSQVRVCGAPRTLVGIQCCNKTYKNQRLTERGSLAFLPYLLDKSTIYCIIICKISLNVCSFGISSGINQFIQRSGKHGLTSEESFSILL